MFLQPDGIEYLAERQSLGEAVCHPLINRPVRAKTIEQFPARWDLLVFLAEDQKARGMRR